MKKAICLILVGLLLFGAVPFAAASDSLVIDKTWKILVPETPTAAENFAAEKLASCLGEVFGEAPEIVSEADDSFIALGAASRADVTEVADNGYRIRAIDGNLYLDARGIGKDELINGFPTIYAKCLELGINITKDMIPIRPAAHYQCGGIKVDRNGESSIHHLYAAGECACTGLHGGNRLASNSLLEAVVYAHNAAMSAIERVKTREICHQVPDWNAEGMVLNEEMVLITQTKRELQELMWNYVGIVRSDLRLQRAFDRLNLIFRETEDLYNRSVLTEELSELRNLIACSYLIIKMARARRENVGLHFSIDLPGKNSRSCN